jgi:beta-glucosidase
MPSEGTLQVLNVYDDVGVARAIDAGARGYLHWSWLDNYEWGRYTPTFGLVAVDRETFHRTPKPSAGWLGSIAREKGASIVAAR